ncbi:MAG: ISKra4 family transposase [Steroidobacteraceae bacterium]
MESYRNLEVLEEYQPARRELERLIGELVELERSFEEHGEIERHLSERGPEVMRLLLQGHLNRLWQAEEVREDVVGAQGTPHRYARERCRTLMSVFGEVRVRRLGYSDHDIGSVFPLDARLNLPWERYSHGLRERLGEAVAAGSYETAVEQIGRHTGGQVPKRQAEQIAQVLAQDFDRFYHHAKRAEQPAKPDLLILSTDGKGIVMRHEDLRANTQRRAQESRHKLASRLSRGEKRNRKRMATVATVYEVAPHYRKAGDIMDPSASRPAPPKPVNKRVWASVQHTPAEVLNEAFAEAKRRDPQGERSWVMLVDGQEEQLRQVYAAIERHEAEVTVIQDFVHVLEYLWQAAWCLHKEADPAAERWVQLHAIDILQGKSSDVAAGMRRSATRRDLSQSERKPLDTCAEYLLKNRERLDYAPALRGGLPIATGVVEGACRHLVKHRMECSGARWSLAGAEAVLRLRALRMSGDWDEYLKFHKSQERLRNYPEERLAA